MAESKKKIKKVHRIALNERIIEYSDGTWAAEKIGENNQVVATRTISAGTAERRLQGLPGINQASVSPSQYKVKQVVRVSQTQSLLQKDDGTWVSRSIGLNNDVIFEQPISAAEAQRLIGSGRTASAAQQIETTASQRGGVSPGAGGPATIGQLERNVAALENARRTDTGDYIVNGQPLLPAEYNKRLNDAKDELARARGAAGASAQTAATSREVEKTAAQDQSVQVAQVRSQLETLRQYTDKVISESKDRAVVTRARAWKADLSARISKIDTYLKQLEKTMRVDPAFVVPSIPSFDQIDTSSPAAEGPFQPSPGQGAFGQVTGTTPPGVAAPATAPGVTPATGALTAAQRREQGVAGPSRFPSLEEINTARANQNLPALELVNGKYREVVSKKEVPASEVATPTGQPVGDGTTVSPGGAGGGAVGGTPTGAVPPTPAAPGAPTVPPAWEQAAREQFGAYYEVVKNIPEVMKIIERDMTVGLSDAQFQAELEKTTWWRTTTASARAWEEDKARDPATVQTRVDNQLAALRDTSLRLGLRLRDDVLAKLAEDSLKFGWSNTVIQNAIGSEALKSTGGVSDLRRGYIGQTLRATAGSYGVPLSDVTFNEWVGKIATGQENEASFQAYALDLAKNLYPSLAASLDKGISFRAITDPYRQAASRILEVNPETIDFADPKWAQAFTARDDKGQQMMMTYGEWNDYLRTNPTFGYEYTDGAKERAFTVANRLAELFGAA